jgi:hypothetical protein
VHTLDRDLPGKSSLIGTGCYHVQGIHVGGSPARRVRKGHHEPREVLPEGARGLRLPLASYTLAVVRSSG